MWKNKEKRRKAKVKDENREKSDDVNFGFTFSMNRFVTETAFEVVAICFNYTRDKAARGFSVKTTITRLLDKWPCWCVMSANNSEYPRSILLLLSAGRCFEVIRRQIYKNKEMLNHRPASIETNKLARMQLNWNQLKCVWHSKLVSID